MTNIPRVEELEVRFQRLYTDEYTTTHKRRLAESYLAIKQYIVTGKEKVLEMGENGNFSDFLLGEHEGLQLTKPTSDLRHYLNLTGGEFDIILNMEVLEHIKDQCESVAHMFDGSGARTFIDECYRLLKPGGYMLLTTPNAHSLDNIERILNYQPPYVYRPHVREYAIFEVKALLLNAGFEITSERTVDVWDTTARHYRVELEKLAHDAKMDPTKYGQDIFIVARKLPLGDTTC
jgi:SAM-dependent methyltransferase